ncbi:succinate dehydrogenase cytochrome b subunit [Actinoallomurus oryzae]|uniref:succinate dehydrogenase cytochrome b subunit n=1 Tax=Actinoallomurus oryzae TaxID=502180 RepID=UPI0031EAF4D8
MSSRASTVAAPPQTPSSQALPRRLYRSSVGKKAVMAVTGAILVLYLIAHMIGNLKVFLGRDDFNHYAHWLRTMGEPALPYRTVLTAIEIVLTVAVILHMWSAVSLARRARRARPVRYAARPTTQEHRYATHVMRYGGIVILLFVIWHLLDLTFGAVNPKGGDAQPYDKVVADFAPSHWYITIFYIVAVVLVGFHLKHGIWSAFQTLGWGRQGRYRGLHLLADVVAAVIVLGFVSVPVFVTIGVVS